MKKREGASAPKGSDDAKRARHEHDAEAAGTGALVGAALGVVGGPAGMIAGAVLGGIAAGVSAEAAQEDAERAAARTTELDAEIGVSGGDGEMGAPGLEHPPAVVGAATPRASSGGRGRRIRRPRKGRSRRRRSPRRGRQARGRPSNPVSGPRNLRRVRLENGQR